MAQSPKNVRRTASFILVGMGALALALVSLEVGLGMRMTSVLGLTPIYWVLTAIGFPPVCCVCLALGFLPIRCALGALGFSPIRYEAEACHPLFASFLLVLAETEP